MDYRRSTGLIGSAAAGALVVGAEVAQAQDDAGVISVGGSLDGLGESISGTVTGAVSGVATSSDDDDDGGVSGGVSGETTETTFGEDDSEAVAIADASGGNNNVSFVS